MKIIFLGTFEDEKHAAVLKPMLAGHDVFMVYKPLALWHQVKELAARAGATAIITTQPALVKKLAQDEEASVSNYAGSYWQKDGIEVIAIHPLVMHRAVNYIPWLTRRFISKLVAPAKWLKFQPFSWTLATPANIEEFYSLATSPNTTMIATDTETIRHSVAIQCVSYCIVQLVSGSYTFTTFLLPIDSMWAVTWMRKFNATPAPKALQNGRYDWAYFARFAAPLTNSTFDTLSLFHSWLSELPKDLGFIAAFSYREYEYHKDDIDNPDLQVKYAYCCRDSYVTAVSVISLINEMPAWAISNYWNEFPTNFPCHMAEMQGLKRDTARKVQVYRELEAEIEADKASLARMLGVPEFNPNSPKQVLGLLKTLGLKDYTSTDEKHLAKASYLHPLNDRILGKILDVRGKVKLIGTYLGINEPSGVKSKDKHLNKDFKGRVLFSLNPSATDTTRLASGEHAFWCGANIQNVPRGPEVKQTIVADDGFLLAEIDLEQAETRDTAYAAGEEKLIAAVEGDRDFHAYNASCFFGIEYAKIFDDIKKKTIDKVIRDLAKKVNHGANYLMGEDVLVDTMGLKYINQAKILLKLPVLWTPRQVAAHLLAGFHKTYPGLAGTFYPAVVREVALNGTLTSRAKHHSPYQVNQDGLVRRCFGNPAAFKPDKNALVAHVGQSLNAQTLNRAYKRAFYEVFLGNPDVKLGPQIHDSIFMQYREGKEEYVFKVKEIMEIPVTIQGYDGKTRTFTVPAAVKLGGKRWSDL